MHWSKIGLIALGLGCLAALGCQSCEHVEAELRQRERQLEQLRDHLERTEVFNECLQRELRELHQQRQSPPGHEEAPLPKKLDAPSNLPEHKTSLPATPAHPVTAITLGRQTGGYDDDRLPGDEALQVVLEPQDPDGHAVKAPGTLHVQALEVTREGTKIALCQWDVSAEQLRRSWRAGLLSTGYFIILPWKVCPSSTKVRVIVQLTLTDGRVLEADRDVTVRLLPPNQRQTPPAGLESPAPLDEAGQLRPPPRKVEGPAIPGMSQRPSASPPAGAIRTASTWQKPAPPTPPAPRSVELLKPVPLDLPWAQPGALPSYVP